MAMANDLTSMSNTSIIDILIINNMDTSSQLVVVFSPPNQPRIQLENINQIHKIKVTNWYIKISIVLCEKLQNDTFCWFQFHFMTIAVLADVPVVAPNIF